jgi:uncharacterized damage-inducible protein DinB
MSAGDPMKANQMDAKETFRRIWDREFRTTVTVFRSFPADQLDVKPHERSRTVRDLAWQCVIDERVIETILSKTEHDLRNVPPAPPPPEAMEEIVTAYEIAHSDAVEKLNQLPEAEFDRTVTSILARGEWKMPRPEALWANVMDQVHHRGQLTIYLRQAGGKVPSIYGPSGDQLVPAY